MSRLLLEWLNNEVELSQEITSFTDFQNGFLIGELLYRYNQQLDFALFKNSDRVQDKIDNYCRLEHSISNLGIQSFTSLSALKMIQGDSREIAELILKIRSSLKNINVTVGPHPAKGFMPGKLEGLTNFVRISKPVFDSERSEFFRRSLSIRLDSQKQVDMRKHLEGFVAEQKRQQDYADRMKELDKEQVELYYQEVRNRKAMNKKAELEYLNAWHEKGIGIWMQNQKRRKYAGQVIKRFHEKEAKKAVERQENSLKEAKTNTFQEINSMESRIDEIQMKLNIIRHGVEEKLHSSNNHHQDEQGAQPDDDVDRTEEIEFLLEPKTADESVNSGLALSSFGNGLIHKLESNHADIPREDPSRVKDYVVELRVRKGTQAATQGRRDRRRTKFLFDLSNSIKTSLESQRIGLLRQCIAKPCHVERQLHEQTEWQKKYVQVIQQNRANRERQYEEQRKREEELAAYRQAVRDTEREEALGRKVGWLKDHLARLEHSVEAARKKSVYEMCHELVYGIVEVSMEHIDHLVVSGGKSCAFPEALDEAVTAFSRGSQDLNQVEFDNYIHHERSWRFQDLTPSPEDALTVGTYLAPLRTMVMPETRKERSCKPVSQRFRMQVALLGGPLAGKSSMAWRLAARFNLVVIEPKKALSDYLETGGLKGNKKSKQQDCIVDDVTLVNAIVTYINSLVSRADQRKLMLETHIKDISQEQTSQLSTEELEERLFRLWDLDASGDIDPLEMLRAASVAHCEGRSKDQVEQEAYESFTQMDFDLNGKITREEFAEYFQAVFGDQKRQALDTLLRNTDELCKPINGWILDGFPNTRNQAKLLEMSLSGMDADETLPQAPPTHTFPSEPAKPVDPSTFIGLERGAMDVVLHLSIEEDDVFHRAATIDTRGTERFRIAPGVLHERNAGQGTRDWYTKFGVFQDIDISAKPPAQVFAALEAPVLDVLDQKARRDEEIEKQREAALFLEKCKAIVDTWMGTATPSQPAVEGEVEAPTLTKEEQDKIIAESFVGTVPSITPLTVVAAGICDKNKVSALCGDSLYEVPQSIAANDCWFKDCLAVSPEEALQLATAYINSEEGTLVGLATHFAKQNIEQCLSIDVESVRNVLQAVLTQAGAGELSPLPVTEEGKSDETKQEGEEDNPQQLPLLPIQTVIALLHETSILLKGVKASKSEDESKQEDEEEKGEEEEEPEPNTVTVLKEALMQLALERVIKARQEKEEQEKKNKKGAKKGATATKVTPDADISSESSSSQELKPVEDALAQQVVSVIEKYDGMFAEESKQTFSALRELREEWLGYFSKEYALFDDFLRASDSDVPKQNAILAFQEKYDSIPQDMRYHPLTKQESHMCVEELARKIWEQIQMRKDEAQERINIARSSKWLGEFVETAMDQYLHLMQLEVSKYQAVRGSLIMIANSQLGGVEAFASPDQASLYTTPWPVAETYGSSLDPDTPFGSEGEKGKKGKKGAKEQPPEDDSAQDDLSRDKRITLGSKVAAALQTRLSKTDLEELGRIPELVRVLQVLDNQFISNVKRLETKANEKYDFLHQSAQMYWSRLEHSSGERFDSELVALEALVFYMSKKIEQAEPVHPKQLILDGCSFLVTEKPPSRDQEQTQDEIETDIHQQ